MARNESGFFKKFLNVIGVVDEPQDEGYGDRYANGRSAQSGRPSTYVPRQQNSRTAETRRRTVVQDERPGRYSAAGTRSRYNDDINEGYTVRRPSAEKQVDDFDAPRQSERRADTARQSAPRAQAAPPVRVQTAPMSRNSGTARTVMFKLSSLQECCDVVDNLIANNIVVLMLDQLDDHMIQRVVDTLSGAAFALHATVHKASAKTYFIAPRTVEVNDLSYFGNRG